MLTLTVAQLEGLLAAFGWPFVRILAFIATEPVLGNRAIPLPVKLALALFVTVAIAPILPSPPAVPVASAAGLLILAQQVLIGAAMGFTARIVVSAAEMAGQLAGLQMGLGFALFFNPESSGQAPLVAEFYGLVAVLTLLTTNAHYVVLTALAESFHVLPLALEPMAARGLLSVVYWGAQIFEVGLMISLPVVGALLIANIAIGILTRAAPQLNIFAVGFPVTLTVGFIMLYLSLPLIVPMIDALAQSGVAAIMQILAQMRPGP
ncbi:MAG: flagellar biosynthetic protein FliR [Betaproteobacteria bacterium]